MLADENNLFSSKNIMYVHKCSSTYVTKHKQSYRTIFQIQELMIFSVSQLRVYAFDFLLLAHSYTNNFETLQTMINKPETSSENLSCLINYGNKMAVERIK